MFETHKAKAVKERAVEFLVRFLALGIMLAGLPSCATEPSNEFNGGAIQVGDTVAGVIVTKSAMQRALVLPDSPWVGDVWFARPIELTGRLMAHPDPEHRASCFEADSATAVRLPRMNGDGRRPWLCFSNHEEAVAMLDPSKVPDAIRITIDSFALHYSFSDGYNTAALKSVSR